MKRMLPKKKNSSTPKRIATATSNYEYALFEYHQTVQPQPQLPEQPWDKNPFKLPQSMSPIPELSNEVRSEDGMRQQSPFYGSHHQDDDNDDDDDDDFDYHHHHHQQHQQQNSSNKSQYMDRIPADATYEEWYGDAYVGAPLKYVYPNGYQSMRPRGGPWKLSIVICLLFTWLSIFVVGNCSNLENEEDMDDDDVDTKWCGSRLLYALWVLSMSITGLSAAYCSIIGYIKVRDFVVANARSQPPGMTGKSDYYPTVADVASTNTIPPTDGNGGDGSMIGNRTQSSSIPRGLYQSDGLPQYLGGHISRPTQAAVAVTNR
jgi:hypothetical protein